MESVTLGDSMKIKAAITQHSCKATAADMARLFRELATTLEDHPNAVLLGLWTSVGEREDEIDFQIVWDDYDSTAPEFDG